MAEAEEVNGEVIEDSRTGEQIPKGIVPVITPENPANVVQATVNINSVGTLQLDENAQNVLAEPLNEADVKIRPDGLVYLPWTYYAKKLDRAFGKLQWGMVPQGSPQSKKIDEKNTLVVWGFWLAIKGIPIGFAYGETSYIPTNKTMSYGDACEGAKSIALARNCKVLGIALELWDADWVREWKKKYAETYEDRNHTLWRKKRPSINKSVETKEAKNAVEGFTPNQLRTVEGGKYIKVIATATGKKTVDVVMYLNTLDKAHHYSVQKVIDGMKENENLKELVEDKESQDVAE